MRNLIIAASLILLVACADAHHVIPDRTYAQTRLSADGTVYVALPADGRYGAIDYDGSGATVAQMLKAALLEHLLQVDIAPELENYAAARRSAVQGGYTYLFFPTITHWEDRATEWSGIPDKVAVRLVVVEPRSGETLSVATIEGTSGLATFGGDHPQDLLPEPIQEHIDQLFEG
jgi:hypothetical protein